MRRCKGCDLSIKLILPRERPVEEKKGKQRVGDGAVRSATPPPVEKPAFLCLLDLVGCKAIGDDLLYLFLESRFKLIDILRA